MKFPSSVKKPEKSPIPSLPRSCLTCWVAPAFFVSIFYPAVLCVGSLLTDITSTSPPLSASVMVQTLARGPFSLWLSLPVLPPAPHQSIPVYPSDPKCSPWTGANTCKPTKIVKTRAKHIAYSTARSFIYFLVRMKMPRFSALITGHHFEMNSTI